MTTTPQYCNHNQHLGKQIPATHYLVAKVENGPAGPHDMYTCPEHLPTVAEVIEHNQKQGQTLNTFQIYRIGDPDPTTNYQRES